MLTVSLSQKVDCLCDFTFNFYWQHEGAELEPASIIAGQVDTGYTYRDLVEYLRSGGDVHIRGSTGSRLASSLGVDLVYFGGSGRAVRTENIIVDNDVGTRMGISMLSGRIYVGGDVSEPLGNVVEIRTDREGYRCYKSITDILHNGLGEDRFADPRNSFTDGEVPYLLLADGILRDTVGARCSRDVRVVIRGDASLSTGILMQKGIIEVDGDAGMNTAVLLSGGTVVVRGNVGQFAAADMRKGNLIITGKTMGYMCSNMVGGAVFIRSDVKVIPPARKCQPTPDDLKMLVSILDTSRLDAMSYRKYSMC